MLKTFDLLSRVHYLQKIQKMLNLNKAAHHVQWSHDDGQLVHGRDLSAPCVQIKAFSEFWGQIWTRTNIYLWPFSSTFLRWETHFSFQKSPIYFQKNWFAIGRNIWNLFLSMRGDKLDQYANYQYLCMAFCIVQGHKKVLQMWSKRFCVNEILQFFGRKKVQLIVFYNSIIISTFKLKCVRLVLSLNSFLLIKILI